MARYKLDTLPRMRFGSGLIGVLLGTMSAGQAPPFIQRVAQQLERAGSDSARVALLGDLAFKWSDLDPQKGADYAHRALELAERMGSLPDQAMAHGYIGYALMRKSDFDGAQQEYEKSIAMYERIGSPCDAAGVRYNLGLNFQARQQQEKALELFLRVLDEERHCPDNGDRSLRYYAVGTVYAHMERQEEALRYYLEAVHADSAAHDTIRMAKELVAVGNVHAALGRTGQALDAYERAASFSEAAHDSLNLGYIHYNMADLFMMRGDTARALERAEGSYRLLSRLGRLAESVHAAVHYGDMLIRTGGCREAESVLLRALVLSDSLGLGNDRILTLRAMAQAKEAQGDALAALDWYKRYVREKDSTEVSARDQQLQELTARFESEKRQKELEASQAREAEANAVARRLKEQRAVYIGGAIVLAALLLLSISRYRLKRRAAEELERVNAEVLKEKERAEESERAKDRFLANVSHEIRTPLNAIMGFTGLLMHEHRDERSARYLGNIREAGDNLLVVINDVLDISRIEAGRLRLMNEPFDIHRSVRLCTEILHHRAGEQGDRFEVDIAPNVPRWVMGDSARLLQILLNLAGNALKFTTNGVVRIALRRSGDSTVMEVQDTGIGIPAEKLATIFDRFSQVEVSDQRKYGGAGLGLAIVKEIVDLHKGTIAVQSTEGKGTTFTISLRLPATDPPEHASFHRHEPDGERHISGRTILVAEDNEMNALVTTETLRRHYPDCQSVVVRTGQEALDRVQADEDGDIALVLMDVQMPVMDGMTATRRIRALKDERARLPVIALTASVLPSDLSRCLDAGMDACVSKPFKAEELIDAIGKLTGDRGIPAGVGYDVRDPRVALFHWLVPPRLKALRAAQQGHQQDEVQRIVHALRPQLVERDARFAALCDRILGGEALQGDVSALITDIENALR